MEPIRLPIRFGLWRRCGTQLLTHRMRNRAAVAHARPVVRPQIGRRRWRPGNRPDALDQRAGHESNCNRTSHDRPGMALDLEFEVKRIPYALDSVRHRLARVVDGSDHLLLERLELFRERCPGFFHMLANYFR